MDKPTKPANLMPRSFGGTKNNFSATLQTNGYEDGVPAIYGGDNLNYQLDCTGKELDYCETICDYINDIPINKTPVVNANNKLVYTQYDIKVYSATETFFENDLLTGIVDGKKHIYRCKQDNTTGQALTNTTYFEQTDIMGNVKTIGRNIGEIVQSTIPLTDAGLHLLDGSQLQYGSYKAFIDYIADLYDSGDYSSIFTTEANWQTSVTTYGVCGKFVYDSVNNTVRLPKITNFTEGTITPSTVGNLTQAGLPNITGEIWGENPNQTGEWSEVSGAFYQSTDANNHYGPNVYSDQDNANIIFDASRSSSIYGNSNTVQPQAIKVLYYIVIATSTKTDIEVDIDEIATDLNGKADVDLTNVNNSGTSLGASWAMPSNTYDSLTVGASGTDYTAPSNGFFYAYGSSTGQGYMRFLDETNNYSSHNWVTQSGAGQDCTLIVTKGDVVDFAYDNFTIEKLRFYYAVGSESEAQ